MSSDDYECRTNSNAESGYWGTVKCPKCKREIYFPASKPNIFRERFCKACSDNLSIQEPSGKVKHEQRQKVMLNRIKENVKNRSSERSLGSSDATIELLLEEIYGIDVAKQFFLTRTWKKVCRSIRRNLMSEQDRKRRSNIKTSYWQKLFQKYPRQMLWELIQE